ncbi:restriction endonuclease [Desulfonema magnum]|uniref:Restriction endonuclease domain-containing protein n=1 Tax=Desulfonema magnum TaxID=45655 RepID=A0A975GK05_9BACT|nr:restriction endonuclease [Desulfonema magnum]QTA84206.1 Restriction endonuclease domain-containing protein [Desulfonema magnum]
MYDEKILPVEEMLAYEEFTDRVEILRELDAWVKNIQRMASPSTAIISPRRMGKTVLLDRLVNTVFFKPEYRVAPFYFRMTREKTTLRKFLLEYATTFFRQYIAYCNQDPVLFQDESLELGELLEQDSEHDAVRLAQKMIRDFLRRYEKNTHEDARNQWDAFIRIPERLASFSGTRVAVIIDEFQEMKFSVYDTSEEHFTELGARGMLTDQGATNLTATYDRQSQSRKAPMLVSGSAVTLIFRTVMGGPLGGRFDFRYLRPLSVPDGAALLHQLLDIYLPDVTASPENALYASAQVGAHPYYLYCLAMSKSEDKKFDDTDSIDRLIRYETEQGKIFGFWQTHFQDNRMHINTDSDEVLGKKIIYYFTRYNNQPVGIRELAEKLNVPKKTVEEKIERLYLADLVWRTRARYYAFNDICLMRYIKFVYENDLEDVEEIDLSQQNLFNNLKGRFLELVVQVTMMKFNNETLDGKFFGKTGEMETPLFQFADTKYVKSSGSRSYQIDVYARERRKGERIWLCECKYTKTKMGIKQVGKLEDAAVALRQEAEELGRTVPDIQMWLVSTGGFTGEVAEYVREREDIFFSDYEGINGIFRAYGGNYNIPVFKEQ